MAHAFGYGKLPGQRAPVASAAPNSSRSIVLRTVGPQKTRSLPLSLCTQSHENKVEERTQSKIQHHKPRQDFCIRAAVQVMQSPSLLQILDVNWRVERYRLKAQTPTNESARTKTRAPKANLSFSQRVSLRAIRRTARRPAADAEDRSTATYASSSSCPYAVVQPTATTKHEHATLITPQKMIILISGALSVVAAI